MLQYQKGLLIILFGIISDVTEIECKLSRQIFSRKHQFKSIPITSSRQRWSNLFHIQVPTFMWKHLMIERQLYHGLTSIVERQLCYGIKNTYFYFPWTGGLTFQSNDCFGLPWFKWCVILLIDLFLYPCKVYYIFLFADCQYLFLHLGK